MLLTDLRKRKWLRKFQISNFKLKEFRYYGALFYLRYVDATFHEAIGVFRQNALMKKVFAIFIGLLIHFSVLSQTITVTTWYVIPPTSGCNGIWAIDATAWPCFTAGCVYSAGSPTGCLSTIFPACDSIVGDTLYLPLCSLPCDIAASCGPGPVVVCGTPPPPVTTDIDKIKIQEIKTSFTDKILNIGNLNTDDFIEIYDISGRKTVSRKSSRTIETIDFNMLSKQIYILLVRNKSNEIVYRKKIAW